MSFHWFGEESTFSSMFVVLCSVVDFVRIHLDLQCKHVFTEMESTGSILQWY